MPEFYITKYNGDKELFDPQKLKLSLLNIGAIPDVADLVMEEVSKNIKDGSSTREIYRMAFAFLKKRERPVAIRYSLKKAIADLGPTGFPFEKFVAEIFKAQGYNVETDKIIKGHCVEHEIDVLAWNEHELILTEAKFHTDFSMKSDLKVALYIKARFDDLANTKIMIGGKERTMTEGWLVTNTKFSQTAIEYGQCQNLNMVGWNYPFGNNLHNMIEKAELIPLTALTTLNTSEKHIFLSRGIVLSTSLLDESLLKEFNFSETRIKNIKTEVSELCEHCKLQIK
ncbi:MAG: restriction endonuclease [Minisyncoccia bacterium]